MRTYQELIDWYYARPLEKRGREEAIPAEEFAELLEFAVSQGHMAPRPGRPLLAMGTYWYQQASDAEKVTSTTERERLRIAARQPEVRWVDL